MIKIFGLRIPTKNDIAILNTNMEKCEEHIKELEVKQECLDLRMESLIKYVDTLQELIDLLADQQVADSKPVKKSKKTKK
jgi:hypothetical protein